jgi:Xaa-Pro aminopeptidase
VAVKNLHVYQERRQRLGNLIGSEALMFIPGAKMAKRNSDVDYPFRQESNFLYLTGFTEPDAFLVVIGGAKPRSILCCNPKDETREIWTGKRFGPKDAEKEFGFDQALANTISDEDSRVFEYLPQECKTIYYPKHSQIGVAFREDLSARCHAQGNTRHTTNFLDSEPLLAEMRLIKDESEVASMRSAATISALAHKEMLSLVRPGMTEVALEAEYTYRFRKAGGDACHAYPPIIAAGPHACTLHHVSTDTLITDGDLVLADAGCEYEGYASDITRTFPANGTFTPEQRAIYAIVLEAQKMALLLARPGIPLSFLHDASSMVITEGLMQLGIMQKADPCKAIAEGLHRAFYPHGVSHWLGLDVHDVGDYNLSEFKRKERRLEAGMVITVEPGIYIQPGMADVDPSWHGIGVRIEDDVLITREGNEVLSSDAPKEIGEIETLMRHAHSTEQK